MSKASFSAGPMRAMDSPWDRPSERICSTPSWERVREDIPLMVWITGASQDETAGTLQALESKADRRTYGGPLFWVDTPLLYHSNRGLSRHYQDLLSFSSRPIILFNDPERVKQAARPLKRASIRTAVLKEIAHMEGMCGLFYRGTMDRARNYQKAVRFRNLFRIYDGDEALFLDHPSRHGVLSAGANLAPKDWQRVALFVHGHDLGAEELSRPSEAGVGIGAGPPRDSRCLCGPPGTPHSGRAGTPWSAGFLGYDGETLFGGRGSGGPPLLPGGGPLKRAVSALMGHHSSVTAAIGPARGDLGHGLNDLPLTGRSHSMDRDPQIHLPARAFGRQAAA